jgi:[ribosomal protein S5]-alanine N-acetyltransferase
VRNNRGVVTVCESARLRLRHLTGADAPFVLELLNDPAFLENVGDRGVRTLEDARRYIETGPVASYARFGFGLWVVELKGPAQAIGLCGLLHRDTHPDVEIGFALLPRFRRLGYAREAARATLALAAGALGLARVVAITAPGNLASIRILESLGLAFERLVRFTAQGDSRLFVLDRSRAGAENAASRHEEADDGRSRQAPRRRAASRRPRPRR